MTDDIKHKGFLSYEMVSNLTHTFFNNIKNPDSFSIISLLTLSITIFLCVRYLLPLMVTLNKSTIHCLPREYAVQMIEYFNPFTFVFHSSNSSYSGIDCSITSLEDCHVVPLWRVCIYDLFQLLHEKNWTILKQSVDDNHFHYKSMESNYCFLLKAGEKLKKTFIPSNVDLDVFQSLPKPRLHYPFVLLLFLKEFPNERNHQLIILANVIHVPDDIVKLPAKLMHQFAKCSNGSVVVVNNIYSKSFETNSTYKESVDLCIVCMSREIAVVIIPCGHACVCKTCFDSCDNCPICRGPKNFYFVSCTVSQH